MKSIIITNICVIILLAMASAVVFVFSPFHSSEGSYSAVSGQWESLLFDHISRVDQLGVYDVINRKRITTITDENEIIHLIRSIEIDEAKSTTYCMCLGDYWFTFKEGSNTIATLQLHDGLRYRLRWKDGKWPKDGILTSSSSSEMHKWLIKHHIKVHERNPSVIRLMEFKRSLFHLPVFFVAIFLSIGAIATFYCCMLIVYFTSKKRSGERGL